MIVNIFYRIFAKGTCFFSKSPLLCIQQVKLIILMSVVHFTILEEIMKRFTLMTLVALLMMAFAATAGAAPLENCSAKIGSFDILLDYSGSMMMKHKTDDMMKFAMARKALLRVNERIPMLTYTGSLHTFAKNAEIVPPQPYNKDAIRQGINSLKETYEVFNRLTPMGDGIAHWSNTRYNAMAAPAAVILVTDGEGNRGMDALAAAQAAVAAKPDLVFHIISVADTAAGQKTLDSIAALKPGKSVNTRAIELIASDAAVDKFVRDVFCGGKLVLRSVQFALGSAEITRQSAAILDEVASMLRQNNSMVQIDGHTCAIGSDQSNQVLSDRRAASVKAYLAKKGVPATSINTRGYGESMPKFDNSTDEGRRLNRRAEIDFR